MATVAASNVSPPPYTEKAPMEKALTSLETSMSAEDRNKVDDAIVKEIEKPTTREQILKEVEVLAQTLVGIENDFAIIGNTIKDIDSKKLIKDDNGAITYFHPTWDGLHKEYTSLLLASQTAATTVKAKIQTLTADIIPIMEDPSNTVKERTEAAKDFADSLRNLDTDGIIEKRFIRLKEDVSNFRINIKNAVIAQKAKVEEELKTLDKKIADLQEEIDRLSGFFTRCWDVVCKGTKTSGKAVAGVAGAAAAYGGIAATVGMATLAPVAAVGLITAGLGAIGYGIFSGVKQNKAELQGKKDELNRLVHRREDLKLEKSALEAVIKQLNDVDGVFDDLLARLGSIHEIWRLLVADALSLAILLEEFGEAKNKLILKQKLKRLDSMYKAFYDVLDKFTLAIPGARGSRAKVV